MISRLEDNILLRHGISVLSSSSPPKHSWFTQVDQLCTKYSLPPALFLLTNPCTKMSFKKSVNAAVIDFWEGKLRSDAALLSSLKYFKPQYYSLRKPHMLWSTAGTNPYEVEKATVQARMLSGRYRCEKLRRHWSENRSGICELEPCQTEAIIGSLEHILLDCQGLSDCRTAVLSLWAEKLEPHMAIKSIFQKYIILEPEKAVQFIFDPSTFPEVITLIQHKYNEEINLIFYLTRTYCHSLHKTKLKLLGII